MDGATGDRRPDPSPHPIDPARARILNAAEVLIARLGFDGTSTARMARAADVTKGLLFYYFPTKADILTALLEERLGMTVPDPTPLIVPGDPEQTLVNLGDRVRTDRSASGRLHDVIWHEAHTRPEVRAVLTHYRHTLHDAIEQALRASLPAPIDAHALRAAASAWAATITARPLEAASGHGHLHDAANLRAIARLLGSGLRSSPSA